MSGSLYGTDFYAWANEQAALLRSGKLSAADIKNIAEEIESMGASERRELVNRLVVLLAHLLKWTYQPARRGRSWSLTIRSQRLALQDHLAVNPSLQSVFPDSLASAYPRAVLAAARQTRLADSVFPETCPWSFNEIMDANFWPDGN